MSLAGLVLAAAVGCGPAAAPRAGTSDSAPSAAAPAQPPDSLVLTTGPYRIWLAEGRNAVAASGAPCYERSVEIRTDSTRTKVPLLYVLESPTVIDKQSVRALLSYRCRPMAVYRVELATGRPFKIEDR